MNSNWSLQNIPDQKGKTFIVTGANSGLGLETSKALASKNAQVIMACRSADKGEQAKNEIISEISNADIEVMVLDLEDLKSVRSFAEKFEKNYPKLDVLINNAGIMMPPYRLTKDGFESQMGTNHLGHFALTALLLDRLKSTAHSRVVNVSSIAHKNGQMDFSNLLYENGKDYSPSKAYGRSKLSNLLFTFELQRFFEKNKIDCLAIAAHPGVSDTNLFKDILPNWAMFLLKPIANLFIQPAAMGALPQLRAAIDPAAQGATYYGPDGAREMKGYPVIVQTNNTDITIDNAKKLWEASEKLTGISFKA